MCKLSRSCCEVLVEAGLAICCINQQAAWWSRHVTKCNLGWCWCFHKPFRQLAYVFMTGLRYSHVCSRAWMVRVLHVGQNWKASLFFTRTFDLWLTCCSGNTACSSWLCESAPLRACCGCKQWVSVGSSVVGECQWLAVVLPQHFAARVHIHLFNFTPLRFGLIGSGLGASLSVQPCHSTSHGSELVWYEWLIKTLKKCWKYWYEEKILCNKTNLL